MLGKLYALSKYINICRFKLRKKVVSNTEIHSSKTVAGLYHVDPFSSGPVSRRMRYLDNFSIRIRIYSSGSWSLTSS